jgi:hypothetical protein
MEKKRLTGSEAHVIDLRRWDGRECASHDRSRRGITKFVGSEHGPNECTRQQNYFDYLIILILCVFSFEVLLFNYDPQTNGCPYRWQKRSEFGNYKPFYF